MKKLILLMLVLALGVFCMFSCTNNNGDGKTDGEGTGENGGSTDGGNGDSTLGDGSYIDPDGWTTPSK